MTTLPKDPMNPTGKKTFENTTYNHAGTISGIKKAFQNANFTKVPLEETLFQILEDFYWKAVDEQKGGL